MSEPMSFESPPNQRRRSRTFKYCGCFLISALAIILWIFLFSHDWNLWRLDRSFGYAKHPAKTKLVDHHKEIGLLVGNGNHCDYFVGELRTYSGSKQSIRSSYKHKTLWNPICGRKQNLEIAFIDNGKVVSYKHLENEIPSPVSDMAWSLKNKQDKKSYYVIYVLDAGYDCGLDIRCI